MARHKPTKEQSAFKILDGNRHKGDISRNDERVRIAIDIEQFIQVGGKIEKLSGPPDSHGFRPAGHDLHDGYNLGMYTEISSFSPEN